MLSYNRGILVAYKDVLNMLELLDCNCSDPKIAALKEHITRRIENYLAHQISNNDIDK